jgi:hypothetical protein
MQSNAKIFIVLRIVVGQTLAHTKVKKVEL